MLEICLFCFIIIVLAYWAFYNRTNFALGYILFVSSFAGLLRSTTLVIGGVEYGTFIINILALIPVFFSFNPSRKIRYVFCFFICFFIYGLLKPVYSEGQTLMDSIKASKSFSSYFFVLYIINFYNKIDYKKISYLILFLSFYYSSLYIFNVLGIKLIPPAYIKDDFIQCHYDSFISYAVCFVLRTLPICSISNDDNISLREVSSWISPFSSFLHCK